jgi:hypothetical protein
MSILPIYNIQCSTAALHFTSEEWKAHVIHAAYLRGARFDRQIQGPYSPIKDLASFPIMADIAIRALRKIQGQNPQPSSKLYNSGPGLLCRMILTGAKSALKEDLADASFHNATMDEATLRKFVILKNFLTPTC